MIIVRIFFDQKWQYQVNGYYNSFQKVKCLIRRLLEQNFYHVVIGDVIDFKNCSTAVRPFSLTRGVDQPEIIKEKQKIQHMMNKFDLFIKKLHE